MNTWRTKVTTVPSWICLFIFCIYETCSGGGESVLLLFCWGYSSNLAVGWLREDQKGSCQPGRKLKRKKACRRWFRIRLQSLNLRDEKDPWDFLYYLGCCKEVSHDLDPSDKQELRAQICKDCPLGMEVFE